jgi:tetratricopeptide (TPR) repeat protein
MSRREEHSAARAAHGLQQVETFWQANVPPAFRRLYTQFVHPFVAPCEFFSLEDIVGGMGRHYGMLPTFLPFARIVGEGGNFGFYLTTDNQEGAWPVLFWDEDEQYLRPVASDFEAFLRYCVLVGRYEIEDELEPDSEEENARLELGRMLEIPDDIVRGAVPRNETELYRRLTESDPQDAVSLCHIGCQRRAQGREERALDYFHRAADAAPWFGDAPYLTADTYRVMEKWDRAVQGWWNTIQRLIPLCTRTYLWNLGEDHPDGEIYEVAADALRQFGKYAEREMRREPLWDVAVDGEPYDPAAREDLARLLAQQGDVAGAVRELQNALFLESESKSRESERRYDSLISHLKRAGQERAASLARFDRNLPPL